MAQVKEYYNARALGANVTSKLTGGHMAGFLAVTSGTLTLVDGGGNTVVNAVAVTAGVYLPIPAMFTPGDQAAVTLAGGASGTLFV